MPGAGLGGGSRALPDLTSRLKVDTSSATGAETNVRSVTTKLKSHLSSTGAISKETEGKIKDLSGRLGQLGPVGQMAGSGIGQVSQMLSGSLGPLTVAGGLAIGLGVALETASEKYVGLAEKVHRYMAVTGESANVASRQVQAFQELGLDTDTAEKAMVKLSKAIETAPKKLQELGIEVAHNAKGNVDLDETLLRVTDAYNGTEDAAKRNLIAITAFGKGGAAMIPVLEAGSAKLRQLEQDVRVVMTDKDIAQAHKYALEQKQVNASWNAMWENIGRNVMPAQQALSEGYLENEYVIRRLREAGHDLEATMVAQGRGGLELAQKLRKEYEAGQAATLALQEETDAHQRAAQAAQEQQQALDELYNTSKLAADASLQLTHAQLNEERAAKNVDQATDALNQAIKTYGTNSEQAHDASLALREAQAAELDSVVKLAEDQETLAEKTAAATGATMTASEKHDTLVQKLEAVAATLAPGSDLLRRLNAYIDTLGSIPASIQTRLSIEQQGGPRQTVAGARAGGGPVLPDSIYTVGEGGIETLVMGPAGTGGMVIPAAGHASSSMGGGTAMIVNLTVEGFVGSPRQLFSVFREGLRKLDQEQK